MDSAPELAVCARGECMGCVPELLTRKLRELIFDVFPIAQLERHEIPCWKGNAGTLPATRSWPQARVGPARHRGFRLVQLTSAAADHQLRRVGRPCSGNFPRLSRLRCMA